MSSTETIGFRETSLNFTKLAECVARTGQGVVVTRRGAPIMRILPVEEDEGTLEA